MDEIKKCPICGCEVRPVQTSHGLSYRGYEVQFSIRCDHCNFKFGNEISKFSVNENGQMETVEDGLSKLVKRWNTRAEEPQEHKESNIEWLIENLEVAKEAVGSDIPCKIVHYVKYGKPCDAPVPDDYCNECEFYEKCGNNESTLLKVLAEQHHEKGNK